MMCYHVTAQAEVFRIDEEGATELADLVAAVRGHGAPGATLAECRSPTAAFMADLYEVLSTPRRCHALCMLATLLPGCTPPVPSQHAPQGAQLLSHGRSQREHLQSQSRVA